MYTNFDKVEIFRVLSDKVPLPTKRCSERGTRSSKEFFKRFGPDIYKTLIKRRVFNDCN